MPLPVLVIVGRPNVGKSTLFNRLVGKKQAIVIPEPGVTRDRHYGTGECEGTPFMAVDTGGIADPEEDPFRPQITRQAAAAIEEGDVVIFLVDGLEGPLPGDELIAEMVRTSGKTALLVVNKTDTNIAKDSVWDFFGLGFGEPKSISAEHGAGVADMLEVAIGLCHTQTPEEDTSEGEIRVAIVGRPNVGKSSLVNKLLGEERSLVSPVPGTTRDPVDSVLLRENTTYRFVDTAGIRKRGKVGDNKVEAVSMILAFRSIERAEVILLVLDANDGPKAIDAQIARHIIDSGRACAILLNKWDLVNKDEKSFDENVKSVHKKLIHLDFAPVVSLSALTGQRTERIYSLIDKVIAAHRRRISTGKLNQSIERWTKAHPPPSGRTGRRPKILYATQASVAPPQIVIFAARTEKLPEAQYRRFLENRIREEFDFEGTSLRVSFRRRESKGSTNKNRRAERPKNRKSRSKPGNRPSRKRA
ncbi:MAG: ribosome biogenesis GTPase Der [Nitrospinaceae bacterium]|jgi:GTPase|nr:ribosome biogenesis GTPase Der [Nitrospinaceae bacterium]MBT3434510.1 ribosome biogenesis GTPase Der [Nitrospinaceae bacterium]MBT3821696.1 ribosome biogenesis GTPase Der [Nitrospinaceae bacterium]MBT4095499.1 ribosome biogenesis GTPase Der [Nitrospinaceae bacterium]MBT4432297.1 ribosome biogenesis GTPase Der [Nitrospinaceae bacterium]